MPRIVHRTCTLCEAICGLTFEVEGDRVLSVRGDPEDVFSKGYVCPKGIAIADVHHDPDRLRSPMRRTPSGSFEPIGWDDALDLAATRLSAIRERFGGSALAAYMGNPVIHNTGALLLKPALLKALGTRSVYSASSQDTSTRFGASFYLYGSSFAIPVPDLDRTDYFLCLGANPVVSNGSVMTAPDMRGRIRAIRARGGKVVIVDPRRTETAREADEHVSILPGGDAALLLAMGHVLVRHGRVDRAAVARIASGWEAVEARLAAFAPERVAATTGIAAATIERLALEFANAPTAVAYSRVGVCNNRFGTVGSYATDLLNIAAGRLGEIGGAMFTTPAIDLVALGSMLGDGQGRWKTRLRGLPETAGDLPTAALAEEIETPGEGQVRGFVTFAGNPVLSAPNGRRLAAALAQLDFMVSIDIYVNETTRHADLILPPRWTLADEHVDVLLPLVAVRNVARWSPPVIEGDESPADWEVFLGLIERLGGGPMGVPAVDRALRFAKHLGYRWRPEKMVNLFLRLGPHGDRFLPWSRGLNLRRLKRAAHGIDLGPLEPGVARRVMHRGQRKVRLAAEIFLRGIDEVARDLDRAQEQDLLLIGRRELRSNNSWMHNIPALVSGQERCTLFVHPRDALEIGVRDGERAMLESRVHRGSVPVRVTDEMRPGVVSLPHGWGHAASAPWQQTAAAHAGVSANDWTDDSEVESLVGESILNGVPVRLRALTAHDDIDVHGACEREPSTLEKGLHLETTSSRDQTSRV